jgi:hypothetical protein
MGLHANAVRWRILNWRFYVPALSLILVIVFFIAYIGGYRDGRVWMGLFGGVGVTIVQISLSSKIFIGKSMDEREKNEQLRYQRFSSNAVAMLSFLGCTIFLSRGSFPKIWVPCNDQDWLVVTLLLISVGTLWPAILYRLKMPLPLEDA